MKINWLPLFGNPVQDKEEIKFYPDKDEEGKSVKFDEQKLQKLRSNIKFKEGEIEFKLLIANSKDKIQIVLGNGSADIINIGINSNDAAYGIAKLFNGKYQHLSSNGIDVILQTNVWLQIKIKCNGSNIEMLVNEVKVCSANSNISNSQIDLIYRGCGDAVIKDLKIKVQLPKAFVVMQFTEEYNSLYNEVIKPICESFGYDVVRADNMYTNELLIEDITSAIRESSLVLADITPDNPNVYYEVGYAHAIDKPTIMLCDKNRDRLPFDVSGFRCIFYENSIAGKSKVEATLKKHLESVK